MSEQPEVLGSHLALHDSNTDGDVDTFQLSFNRTIWDKGTVKHSSKRYYILNGQTDEYFLYRLTEKRFILMSDRGGAEFRFSSEGAILINEEPVG